MLTGYQARNGGFYVGYLRAIFTWRRRRWVLDVSAKQTARSTDLESPRARRQAVSNVVECPPKCTRGSKSVQSTGSLLESAIFGMAGRSCCSVCGNLASECNARLSGACRRRRSRDYNCSSKRNLRPKRPSRGIAMRNARRNLRARRCYKRHPVFDGAGYSAASAIRRDWPLGKAGLFPRRPILWMPSLACGMSMPPGRVSC